MDQPGRSNYFIEVQVGLSGTTTDGVSTSLAPGYGGAAIYRFDLDDHWSLWAKINYRKLPSQVPYSNVNFQSFGPVLQISYDFGGKKTEVLP